jgi:hypothetical protein
MGMSRPKITSDFLKILDRPTSTNVTVYITN